MAIHIVNMYMPKILYAWAIQVKDLSVCMQIDLGDWDSIPGRVIPKTQKMLLDTSLLNTQNYTVCIKGKVEQLRLSSSVLLYGCHLY